jgi:hypothetical protein
MLNLASKVWKCTLFDAVRRLVAAGIEFPANSTTEQAIGRFECQILDEQERCHALVAEAATGIVRSNRKIAYLFQQLGWAVDNDASRAIARLGQFFGVTDKMRALRTFYPDLRHSQFGREHIALFKGSDWDDVVAIPFNDLPGRFSGYLFIGRRARPSIDHAYRIIDAQVTALTRAETGVCMYGTMDQPIAHPETHGNRVFVFNDPVLALRLQIRHMQDMDLPLPIVGTYPARIRRDRRIWDLVAEDIWTSRPDKEFVFWSKLVTPDIFNAAARVDAKISVGTDAETMRRVPSHTWLCRAAQRATHWATVLDNVMSVMPADVAETFLEQLTIPSDSMRTFRKDS